MQPGAHTNLHGILLVVDDDVEELAIRRLLRKSRSRHQVWRVSNHREAMQLLREAQLAAERWMLLVDMFSPLVLGAQLLLALRSDPGLRALPVAALVTCCEERRLLAELELPLAGYFYTPCYFGGAPMSEPAAWSAFGASP